MRSQQQRKSGRKQRNAVTVIKDLDILLQDFVAAGRADKKDYEQLVNEIDEMLDGYLEKIDGTKNE